MKLLEKDIHEKQDTLIGLRQQLEEVKAINIEMYQKLQVNSASKFFTLLEMEPRASHAMQCSATSYPLPATPPAQFLSM
jgi:hypothetical protein